MNLHVDRHALAAHGGVHVFVPVLPPHDLDTYIAEVLRVSSGADAVVWSAPTPFVTDLGWTAARIESEDRTAPRYVAAIYSFSPFVAAVVVVIDGTSDRDDGVMASVDRLLGQVRPDYSASPEPAALVDLWRSEP